MFTICFCVSVFCFYEVICSKYAFVWLCILFLSSYIFTTCFCVVVHFTRRFCMVVHFIFFKVYVCKMLLFSGAFYNMLLGVFASIFMKLFVSSMILCSGFFYNMLLSVGLFYFYKGICLIYAFVR